MPKGAADAAKKRSGHREFAMRAISRSRVAQSQEHLFPIRLPHRRPLPGNAAVHERVYSPHSEAQLDARVIV